MIPKYFNLYDISSDFAIEKFFTNKKIAIYTLDIETDYNGEEIKSLKYVDQLINIFNENKIPLTVFLEGQLIENHKLFIKNFINNSLIDLNLHCYNHQSNGDTPETLNKSIDIFNKNFGKIPRGYRANSYHLNKELIESLINNKFKWDSSIMPALTVGGNISKSFLEGDYFKIDQLYEFPLAHYKNIRIAYNHSNQMLLKFLTKILDNFFKIPNIFVYDMHMYDLYKVNSLSNSPLPKTMKLAYNFAWTGYGKNSLKILNRNIKLMKTKGYEFMSLNELYDKIIKNEI